MWRNTVNKIYLFKVLQYNRSLFNLANCHTMESVYVKLIDGEEKFSISFMYQYQNGRRRQYNFMRSQQESLATTLDRMNANITKKLVKKKTKKKGLEEANDINNPISIALLQGNDEQWDNSVICKTAWVSPDSVLVVGDSKYKINLNPPTVLTLKLSTCQMMGYSILPTCEVEFADLSKCSFQWYREVKDEHTHSETETRKRRRSSSSDRGDKYELVGSEHMYTPKCDDIGKKLKVTCVPSDGIRVGSEVECMSKVCVTEGPKNCPFENRHNLTKYICDENSIRMVTYNILADVYADSDFSRNYLFPHCPPDKLAMPYRKYLIMKEIQGYNADIICLQEVDQKIYIGELSPFLSDHGFEGLFYTKQKNNINPDTGDCNDESCKADTVELAEDKSSLKTEDQSGLFDKNKDSKTECFSQVKEGCATFFRKTKFRLLEQYDAIATEVLKKDEALWQKICSNKNLQDSLEKRTTVIQVSLLETREGPKRKVLVATTHLFFHPRANNVRLLQTMACMKHLQAILDAYKSEDVSVIFCGDLNANPINAVHELLTRGKVKATHADWYSAGKDGYVSGLDIETSLLMTSACGYPQYTNYVPAFSGCLDYIYIDSTMKTKRIIPLPSHDEVTQLTALPSELFPSDHLALVCDLTWDLNDT